MKLPLVTSFVLASLVLLANGQSIEECLKQDSISCIQNSLYRRAKEFFDKESFEIVSGVRFVKSKNDARGTRNGWKHKYEQEVDQAAGVAERQSALENFVGEEVSDFFTGRSLKINFAPAFERIGTTARAISKTIPSEVRQAADEIVEGRGKKKLLKTVLPLLLAAKLKIGVLATLAYFAIALLAKKAILASVISIAVSAFLGLKSLWASKASSHDITGYNAGWSSGGGVASSGWSAPAASAGWSSGGSGWDDAHGAYSAQSQAYSGYHH